MKFAICMMVWLMFVILDCAAYFASPPEVIESLGWYHAWPGSGFSAYLKAVREECQ